MTPPPDRPNPTATAIAAWLREVAANHRLAGERKIAVLEGGQSTVDLGDRTVEASVYRVFAQGNLNEAQLLEVLAYQVEQRTWPTEGPDLYVHHLHHGGAACGRPDVPGDWPAGHKWSADWADVTCPACLERLRAGASPE